MRILHLCFELHSVAKKEDFVRENQEVYQPFLALLERNVQKWPDFKISLVVSGAWLERAEKFDAELIARLRKLVREKRVELVATTFYHSLANFFDPDEAEWQVERDVKKVEDTLSKTPRVLALPELVYNDRIGRMAEQAGFAAMLAGGAPVALDWRSANHIYEAVGCEYLRLIFPNTRLSKMIAWGDQQLLVEKKSDDEEKPREVLSAVKLRKMLDLECLRGGLVTLYFEAEIFATQRQKGVAKFFDDLISDWQENGGNRFVGVTEACVLETPTAEISVEQTVNWREDRRAESVPKAGIVRKQDIDYQAPAWLNSGLARKLYDLKKEILAAEDEKLLEDFRELTAIEWLEDLTTEEFGRKLESLKERAAEVKKSQAVEISRVYTKRHDRGLDGAPAKAEGVISEARRGGVKSVAVHGTKIEDVAQAVPVRRLSEMKPQVPKTVEPVVVEKAEVSEKVETDQVEEKKPKRTIRKIIKRLVIE